MKEQWLEAGRNLPLRHGIKPVVRLILRTGINLLSLWVQLLGIVLRSRFVLREFSTETNRYSDHTPTTDPETESSPRTPHPCQIVNPHANQGGGNRQPRNRLTVGIIIITQGCLHDVD